MKLYLSLFVILLSIGCKKTLESKNEDYNEWYITAPFSKDALSISCEESLIANQFETGINISGYSSHSNLIISAEDDSEYEVTATHGFSLTKLKIKIKYGPHTFIGRRYYLLGKDTQAGFEIETVERYEKAHFFTNIGTLENDTLFVDYYEDSIVFSFCDVKLESTQRDEIMHAAGRITTKF